MTAYTRAMLRTFERQALALEILNRAIDLIVRLTPASKRTKAQARVEGFRKKIASDPDGLIQLKMFSTLLQLLELINSPAARGRPRKKQGGYLKDIFVPAQLDEGQDLIDDIDAEKARLRNQGTPKRSIVDISEAWLTRALSDAMAEAKGSLPLTPSEKRKIRMRASELKLEMEPEVMRAKETMRKRRYRGGGTRPRK